MKKEEAVQGFRALMQEINHLTCMEEEMMWDTRVNLPPRGAEYRSELMGYLSGQKYKLKTSPQMWEYLQELSQYTFDDVILNRMQEVARRDYDRLTKIPADLEARYAKHGIMTELIWQDARQNNDYESVKGVLKNSFEFKREYARCFGCDSVMDYLLDNWEQGCTTAQVDGIFSDIKGYVLPLLDKIRASGKPYSRQKLQGFYPREQQLALIRRDAAIRVLPYGSITRGQLGEELSDMAAMAPYVAAFSDDGRGVQSEAQMRLAMETAKGLHKLIVAHCEDNSLLHGGYIHDGAYARTHGHRGICSESEWGQIRRDLELVRQTGCGYHVCHISTKESVALIRRAKAEGLDVTCETAPHYLLMDETMLQEDGRFKMNPPLRSPADREALLEGLADGTIDMIATDHAPHSTEEKSRGLEKSAMGIVGLETAFPLLYTYLVKPGLLSFPRLMELLHDAPCRRFGLPQGELDGPHADFTVFDLAASYPIDPADFLSQGKATPFTGWPVQARCLLTVCNGRLVWQDGDLFSKEDRT